MSFLTQAEMAERAPDLRAALAGLLAEPSFTAKPGALQWQFLQAVLERMLEPGQASPFDRRERVNLAQFKFEVADRLQRYYLRPGKPVRFLFSLVHRSSLEDSLPGQDWPTLGGYLLRVRDLAGEAGAAPLDPNALRAYLERVVAEACMAEFQAYQALPEVRGEVLERWFVADGPAHREILSVLARRRAGHWTLATPMNPSTMRILEMTVRSVTDQEAVVATSEYWYLCWQDSRSLEATYPYRETNRQLYTLLPTAEGWKVFQNLRPMPKSTALHRKVKRT